MALKHGKLGVAGYNPVKRLNPLAKPRVTSKKAGGRGTPGAFGNKNFPKDYPNFRSTTHHA